MIRTGKKAGAVLLSLLLLTASACGGEDVKNTIHFADLTEESIPWETRVEVSVSVPDGETVIPTITEQPYTPEIDLAFFTNLGIIDESVQVGNMRDRPSTDGNIVGRFYPNTGMEVLDGQNGWYHVISGGIEGFVSAELVNTGQLALDQAFLHENVWVCVTAASLNVRMEPSTDTGIVARVIEGQTYRIVGESGDFYKITIGTEEGYIAKEFCRVGYTVAQAENWNQLANIGGTAQKVIAWGMQYLGLPYVFGGESMATGCDCSYFSGMCIAQSGIHMSRTSREQAEGGTPVSSMAEARPGDLLFYSSHGTVIDHVAVYIGDNKILHAAQSIGCVSISAYNYCGQPVAIRRYLN